MVWQISDEALLSGFATGDPDLAAAFIRRFQPTVYGVALAMLREPLAAEEAAQETFFRAWRHASQFDPRRGTLVAWLAAIARNASIDQLRLRRSIPEDAERIGLLAERAGRAFSRDTETVSEQVRLVRDALAEIPLDQRRALFLASFLGYSAKQISQSEGIPLGTAKTRIRAALIKLADLLSEARIDE